MKQCAATPEVIRCRAEPAVFALESAAGYFRVSDKDQ